MHFTIGSKKARLDMFTVELNKILRQTRKKYGKKTGTTHLPFIKNISIFFLDTLDT